MIDPSGNEIPVQHISKRDAEGTVQHPDDMVNLLRVHRFEIVFEAADLPLSAAVRYLYGR